ncbi:16S rRNA (uracil(1498)-N(3))-methyltransferase [Paracoccus pacificus]|uniref:Ribosomal RNA small subunit methyltransferase E n=1 Tax=Paracoccus pacificus TaxID=1463598 RepID=A0ABW4RAC4_9RHOB
MANVRLYLDRPLGPMQAVAVDGPQAHYLFAVMRLEVGASVELFNGRDGSWSATVQKAGKRNGELLCQSQSAPQRNPPDLWLIFAPIKKARTDFIVEKAAELGVARILPVQTDHTNSERIRQDRLQAHAIGAAEQCGGNFVAAVTDLTSLSRLLDGWDPARRILWADESRAGPAETLAGLPAGPWAILIGPEGGFSAAERARLAQLPFVDPVSLGPRILRADTAAVAAISLWQAALGDWRGRPATT